MTELVPTARTTGKRLRDRYRADQAELYAVLDEGLVCHVSYVSGGEPRLVPTLHTRVENELFLHGSTGSGLTLHARSAPLPVVVAVTLIDGLIFARSGFNHSANYRSAVVHGDATLVTDPAERARILDAFVDRMSPGRSTLLRAATPDELAATAVLRVSLDEASVKVRAHGVADDPIDVDEPVWAGVVPLRISAGVPVPDGAAATSFAVPALPPTLRG